MISADISKVKEKKKTSYHDCNVLKNLKRSKPWSTSTAQRPVVQRDNKECWSCFVLSLTCDMKILSSRCSLWKLKQCSASIYWYRCLPACPWLLPIGHQHSSSAFVSSRLPFSYWCTLGGKKDCSLPTARNKNLGWERWCNHTIIAGCCCLLCKPLASCLG